MNALLSRLVPAAVTGAEGAAGGVVPRFAGGLWTYLKKVLPQTPADWAMSVGGDAVGGVIAASLLPGRDPAIGFKGATPLERAGAGLFGTFAQGTVPSIFGRGAGYAASKALGGRGGAMLPMLGEMGLQTAANFLPNPILDNVVNRYNKNAQEYQTMQQSQILDEARAQGAKEALAREQQRRRAYDGADAGNSIRPMYRSGADAYGVDPSGQLDGILRVGIDDPLQVGLQRMF